jgi:hypothetical protein
MRSRHNKVKETLLRRILATFPGHVNLIREQCGCRRVLQFSDGLKVSVVISQCVNTTSHGLRWNVFVNQFERSYVTLICRCSVDNRGFKDFYVVPGVDPPKKLEIKTPRKCMFRIKENDLWLKKGRKLTNLSQLWRVSQFFAVQRSPLIKLSS